jgi:MFS family permease
MGYQVDKFNRKYLLIICGLTWNLTCACSYFVNSFSQLLIIRIVFAILSSVHTPACISLINDYFKHEKRSRANSLYVAAVSIGVGFANLTSILN